MKKELPQKEKTPAQIGKERYQYVKKYFETCHVPQHQVEWLAIWVRDEVRKAIRRERGMKR